MEIEENTAVGAENEESMSEVFASSGIVNPDTGKTFTSYKEFKEYSEQHAAKATGKSIEEMREEKADREYIRNQRRKEAENEQKKQEKDSIRDFAAKDIKDFKTKYPDVDPAKLEGNERFRRFAKGRLYKEALADIYEDYMEFASESERAALAKKDSKDSRSTGTGGSGGEGALSAAEDKALKEWNERYPNYKMTAKEWKSR